MPGTTIRLDVENEVATLTLTPAVSGKPPTMDMPFFDSLESAVAAVEVAAGETEQPGVRVAVLRSAGDRFFCAGGDIAVLETLDTSTMGPWVERGHQVLARLEALPIPVVAVVTGYALGGGLELALAADLILSGSDARLGQTETRLGFVSGWGGGLRVLRRVGLARAKELFFRGAVVSAQQAADLGLVDFCGSVAEVEEHLARLVADVSACSPSAVSAMKRILGRLADAEAHSTSLEVSESTLLVSHPETVRRVTEFLDSRRKL